MDCFRTGQIERNRAARDRWELYAGHREQVTRRLLASRVSASDRLCVLGAGNCNDVDLAQLTEHFAQVHLVDLDGEALAEGAARQHVAGHPKITLHGDVDLTGVLPVLTPWSPEQPPTAAELENCLRELTQPASLVPTGPVEVVASVCLLSQLVELAVLALGQEHARFPELMFHLRGRHLRNLLESLVPGGRGLLVTDIVSSQTAAAIATVAEAQLPALVGQLIERRNFFHGCNPFVLRSLFTSDPALAPCLAGVSLSRPWRWNFGPRVYAVCALSIQRVVQ